MILLFTHMSRVTRARTSIQSPQLINGLFKKAEYAQHQGEPHQHSLPLADIGKTLSERVLSSEPAASFDNARMDLPFCPRALGGAKPENLMSNGTASLAVVIIMAVGKKGKMMKPAKQN